MLAAVCTLADVLNITVVKVFCHTTKKIFFLVLSCFFWQVKCQCQNLSQITSAQIQMKIFCDIHHAFITNTHSNNVIPITLNCQFALNLYCRWLFIQHFCDADHANLSLPPYINVMQITLIGASWTVERFSARFRHINRVRLPLPPH